MIRAALEGVIYNLYTVFLALTECMDGPVARIQATGGFARSDVWRQMMADIFESEVVVPESYESSCLGACILGLYATGKIDSFDVVSDMVGSTHRHAPKEESAKEYRKLMPIFINLSRALENEYTQIANYQRSLTSKNRGRIGGVIMPLLIVAIGIVALLLLIMGLKLNTFVSLIIVSFGVALALGMPFDDIVKTIEQGLGGTLGHIALIFGLGAMLGKLIADSGALSALR